MFEVAEEAIRIHRAAFDEKDPVLQTMLDAGGEYAWRVRGEEHTWTPDAIAKLQHSARQNSYATYKEYAALINDQSQPPHDVPRPVRVQVRRLQAGADRGSRAGRGDRQALLHRRHVARFDLDRGAHGARDRDEPHRRQVQHRRGRRGPQALCAGQGGREPAVAPRPRARRSGHPAAGRRLAQIQDQAGRLGPLRRYRRISRLGRDAADQDRAGREAGRGRPAAGQEGLGVHRRAALLDARRRADLAAAAPRHLLDRGHRAADPRPEERESRGRGEREAGVRGGRGHHRRRRGEGEVRPRHHLRPRRRHRAPRPGRRSCTPARPGSWASPRRSRR